MSIDELKNIIAALNNEDLLEIGGWCDDLITCREEEGRLEE